MKENDLQQSYPDIPGDQLTLRDRLAISRTVLANERTLMAYYRTALAVLITGISLIKFFDSLVLEIIGWVLLPVGAVTVFIGTRNYRCMSRSIYPKSYKKECDTSIKENLPEV